MATERRWIVLGQDGRHVTLGRAAPPGEADIKAIAAALAAQGEIAWLATLDGAYWSRGKVVLTSMRVLVSGMQMDWNTAGAAFHRARSEVMRRS